MDRYISLKIGVKPEAKYVGGFNLFGEKFGDYPQNIIMEIYEETEVRTLQSELQ